jgi:hypothetical protein
LLWKALGLVALSGLLPLCGADAQDWTRREFPLAPPNATGNFVAPYFDGFYPNADGSYTLSFGFLNRNDSELIEIPLGANNFIEPTEYDGVQPTTFPVVGYSGFGGPRERGAFGVIVPADFEGDVWWTVRTNGYETRVPGRLESPGQLIKGAYELSTGPMAAGSMRPSIQFSESGPSVFGIEGIWHPDTLTTAVGEAVRVDFWTRDRGERELGFVNMTLWKHQGPVGGRIAFPMVRARSRSGSRCSSRSTDPMRIEDASRRRSISRACTSFASGSTTSRMTTARRATSAAGRTDISPYA